MPEEPQALPDTSQGQQPGSRERGRPRPSPGSPPASPAPSSVSPEPNMANSNTGQTRRPWVWFWPQQPGRARAQEGVRGLGQTLVLPHHSLPQLPCLLRRGRPASHRHAASCRPPPPPSVLQLVLQGRMHKGHSCVHEHGHPLSAAARGASWARAREPAWPRTAASCVHPAACT